MAVFASVVVPVVFESRAHAGPDDLGSTALAGTDPVYLSEATAAALRLAARLVGAGTLHLVHATPHFGGFSRYGGAQGAWLAVQTATEAERAARDYSREVLERVAGRVCPDSQVVLHVGPGKPSQMILNVAAAHTAQAIVLAGSGHGKVRRALGSTADKVVRAAACPVFVIPAGS